MGNFYDTMHSISLTCQAGLESLVHRDSKKLWLQNITVSDRFIQWKADLETVYRLLVWSRFANRVYLELAKSSTQDFDWLFDLCFQIPWSKYIDEWKEIITEATAIRSKLSHLPSIQSITKKAIIKSLTKERDSQHWNEKRWWDEIHIHTIIKDDKSHILLDITGLPLHKRWWRKQAGEAPLKENLAAALVAFSLWRFWETFVDPMCGSGTIAIEAALLARNIAPGKNRSFAIKHTKIHDEESLQNAKSELAAKEYPSGKYTIIAADRDESIIQIAKENAKKAGVLEDIDFRVADFKETIKKIKKPATLVSNPPYGVRLETEDLDDLYREIFDFMGQKDISGGIITSYEGAKKYIDTSLFKNRKLYNGSIESRFWYKKKS